MDEEFEWAYGEDEVIGEFLDYLKKEAYGNHYGDISERETQPVDVFFCTEHGESFCIASAVKYLLRYGKKHGRNRKDLLKAMHYIVWVMTDQKYFKKGSHA